MERGHSYTPEMKQPQLERKEKVRRIVRATFLGIALSFPGAETLAQHKHPDNQPHEHKKPVPTRIAPKPNRLLEKQPSKSEPQAKTEVSTTKELSNNPEKQGQVIEQALEKAEEQLQNSEDGTNVVKITDPVVEAALKASIDRAFQESKDANNWMSVTEGEPPDDAGEHEHEHAAVGTGKMERNFWL